MLYKKLYFQIILRVVLLLANALLLAYIHFLDKFVATQINLLLLLFAQGLLLIYYLNKTNRDLANFFSSVSNQDSTIVFEQDKYNKSYSKLHKKLNDLNKVIEQAKIEKIGQYEYLKQVVNHVGTGILSFDEDLKIQFFNPAAKEILKISNLKSLNDLDKIYPGFAHKIMKLHPNNQQLINLQKTNSELDLSVKLVEFKISNKTIKLISFQNIQSELDKKEVESWQKIIRVLTHEIMNSVSPIDSATTSINRLFKKENEPIKANEINEDTINKTIKGMNIIQQRSKGMLDFVQRFRDLTLLPEPVKEELMIKDLYQTIEILFAKNLKENSIIFEYVSRPENLTLMIDKSQIEQVLINLVKNSIESLKNTPNPKIKLLAYKNDQNRTSISINDNGQGINDEIMDNIFIPFFTTKENLSDGLSAEQAGKAGGSGIGLSLSRQIMHLHGGNISVKSEPNVETVFTLHF